MMKWKRITAILMTAVMTLTMPGVPTLAVEIGTSCDHEHTDDCYTLVRKCIHEHDESCYSDLEDGGLEKTATASDTEELQPTACDHECSEESGCITKELNCGHERGEHDDTCGYVPAKEETLPGAEEELDPLAASVMAATADVETISGSVTWDSETKTTPVKLSGNTTITLSGENSIEISDTTESAALDMSDFDLTIQGTGSLTVEVPTGKSAIADTRYSETFSTTLTIKNAQVNTKGGSSGLKAKAIVIESGELNLHSDYGITTESLTMSGGTLYATGSMAIYSRYKPERNINSGLTILYSDKSNADVDNMLDGTVDDTKKNSEVKTIYIAKMPARPRLTVDTQQGTLREGLGDQTATFSVDGSKIKMETLKVEWEGEHTGLNAEISSDGKTITVTAGNAVKKGIYKLKLTADGVDGSSPASATTTATVNVSDAPITITQQPEVIYKTSEEQPVANVTVNASLAAELNGNISYQWYVNETAFAGDGSSSNSITLTQSNLTTTGDGNWEHSGQVYCVLSYPGYTVQTNTVTVTLSTCTHENYTHEGKCKQCGVPCGENVLFISEEGVAYGSELDNGKAMIGAALSSGGTYYFVRDVDASLEAGYGEKIDANLTLNLQNHKIKELDLQDFPHNSVTIKNGIVQNITAESTGKLVLDGVTIETQTDFSDKFDLTVKGSCVFPNNMTFSGKTQLQGGTFSGGINVTTEEQALALLADGYAFAFDYSGAANSLVDVSMESGIANVVNGSVKVIPHSCQYVNGKCACGRSCNHEGKMDADGYCTFCKALVEAFETGGKRYTSLESALAAAIDESTIYLRGSLQLDLNSPVEISKNILLDLQGHTLSTPCESELLRITGSNVAIVNGVIKSTSSSKSKGAVIVGALNQTDAKLTVENVTFEGSVGGGIEIRAYGLNIRNGNEAVVNSGTFNGGIYTEGRLTMSGGSADRLDLGSISEADDVTLSGGSFGSIKIENDENTYQSLLTVGYAYQKQNGTFVKPADMNKDIAVTVVKCTHPDGIHGENVCVYCGMTCRHENVENGICRDCGTNGIIAKVDGTAYMRFTDALAAVRNSDGKTLKLCADAQYVGSTSDMALDSSALGYKKLTIDLNGYRLSGEENAVKGICVVDGAELVIVDSSENKSGSVDSINVTVRMTAGGKLTLESGAIDSLMVDSSSVATLNGGRLRYLTTGSSQLCYRVGRLFEHSGRYLKNESTGEVADLSQTSVGNINSNEYYTIMTTPAEVSEGSKSGNAPINKKRVPFDVSVTPADNTGIASVKFDWYLAGLGAEALKPALASYTAVASENGTYTYNPAQASADPTAWADMKIDDTKELCCIMTAQDADGKAIWAIAASDYMLTIDKTSIEDAVITSLNGHDNSSGNFIVFPRTNSAEADELTLYFKVQIGDETLENNTDYTILGDSNIGANAGTYTLKIQGIGKYSGTKEFTWHIYQHRLGMPSVNAVMSKVYDGTTTVTPGMGDFSSKEEYLKNEYKCYDVKMEADKDYKILSADFDSPDAGGDKVLTIKVELLNPNYIFEDGEKTAVFRYWNINNNGFIYKITKADVPEFTKETSLTIVNDRENVYTVDLPVLPELEEPKQYGTVTYEISGIDLQNGYYTDGAKVENGRLSLPIQKNSVDTTGHVGTVDVTVKSTNYNDVVLTVNVSADNKKIPDVTAPAANTLTYNGAEQELVTAGKTTGGTMLYRCGNSEWSEKVPTAKDAGEYIVWYKVQGDMEYADVAEQSVRVTIEKKEDSAEVVDKDTDTGSSSNGSGSSGNSDDSDDSDNSSSGSRKDSNVGKDLGKVTRDPEKGQVSSEKGIITGVSNSTVRDGYSHWMRDEHGWWLRFADNTYPKAAKHGGSGTSYAWELVNGSWWAFDENGYIKTGWLRDETLGGWFYVDAELGMRTGWVLINGVWYYFHPTSDGRKGIMYAARKTPDGYYVDENGAWDGKAK